MKDGKNGDGTGRAETPDVVALVDHSAGRGREWIGELVDTGRRRSGRCKWNENESIAGLLPYLFVFVAQRNS